jgi:hypothetical protein
MMSTASTSAKSWAWTPEVLELAVRHQIKEYLEPLRDATQQLFPELVGLRIFVEADAELPDHRVLALEATVPFESVERFSQQQRDWFDSFFAICPAPVRPLFCLLLLPVK